MILLLLKYIVQLIGFEKYSHVALSGTILDTIFLFVFVCVLRAKKADLSFKT